MSSEVIALYRAILRHARVFPSIKRASMVKEIQLEFRANAGEMNAAKMEEQRQMAMKGLQQLRAYTNIDDG
ncbi:unnamed protein product, partial [Chrysoparadoxa australica]